MPTVSDALLGFFVQHLPADGGAVGNSRHRQVLSEQAGREFGEEEYNAIRDRLVADGRVLRGPGRGGSVRRAAARERASVAAPAPKPAPVSLFAPEEVAPTRAASPRSARAPRGAARPSASAADPEPPKADVLSYRHSDRRRNNPEVGMVGPESDPAQPKTTWAYDPHLDPALQFDVGRAGVERLIDDALASGDPEVMRAALTQLRRQAEPYLAWAGKAERTSFEVDTVSLHVHERIDPASILSALRRSIREGRPSAAQPQLGLFTAPFENLPLRDAIDFYKHDKGWSNRLVAGESLLVARGAL